MRIGTISQGKVKCDECGQTVPYAERYIIVKESDGIEDEEKGEARRYCVKCAGDKGYVQTRQEKGEHILTFFQNTEKVIETVEPLEETTEDQEEVREEAQDE